MSSVVPQFFPAHWLEDSPDIAFTDFSSCIRIGYVIRGDGQYSYLHRDELAKAGLTLCELHSTALHNLHSLTPIHFSVAKTPGGSEAFLGDTDDNFRAARILLPEVHEALVGELGEEYFAAIPCRDWFFCWSKQQAHEWQARNISQARSDFLDDDYRLTPDILWRSKTGFSLYNPVS